MVEQIADVLSVKVKTLLCGVMRVDSVKRKW